MPQLVVVPENLSGLLLPHGLCPPRSRMEAPSCPSSALGLFLLFLQASAL